MAELDEIVASPDWLPHKLEADLSALEFVHIDRERHRTVTFLEDQYYGPDVQRRRLPFAAVQQAVANLGPMPPPCFIFHSSMAASTLLARVFDQPGVSMSLAEPIILNLMASMKRRRVAIAGPLSTIFQLLSRPFSAGERIVIKPGNSANLLLPDLVAIRPDLRALAIEAPIATFLRSIAKKGMVARIIYRRLYALLSQDRALPTGFSSKDVFEQTDLQIAGMTWLLHHAEFEEACRRYSAQMRSIDSAQFLADKSGTLDALFDHFGIKLDSKAIAEGPIFKQHSKELGRKFDEHQRAREHEATQAAYGEEIDMVAPWIEATAAHLRLPMRLANPLVPLAR